MNGVRGAIARILDPPLLAWSYLFSYYKGRESQELFDNVQTYCMFIGYPRSGHSLVGSLLDAHPNGIIAHELDALKFIKAGVDKHQLYQLLLDNSQRFVRRGRGWTGYTYEIPRQWQGRFDELRVIGDKKAGAPPYGWRKTWTLAPVARDRRHRDQVHPHRQKPLRQLATMHKCALEHGYNPALIATSRTTSPGAR